MAILALPLLLSAPFLQDLPSGLPHSTRVVRSLSEETYEPGRHWVVLQPAWIDPTAPSLLSARSLEDLGDWVADLNGWDPGTRRRWLEGVAPVPVPVEYRLVEEPGEAVLLGGTDSVWPGLPVVFSETVERSVVADFHVQIAQNAAVASPSVGTQTAGVSLSLRLLPVGAGWQAELAVVGSEFGQPEAIDTGYAAIQGKDRLHLRFHECGLTSVLAPGKPESFVVPGPDGRRFRLELLLKGDPPPLAVPGGQAQAMAVPALAARPDWPAFLASLQGGELWSSREGYLAFAGGDAHLLAQSVAEATAEASRSLRYELEVLAGEKVLARFVGAAVQGTPVRFATGRLSQALTRWDAEVAQGMHIVDPEFETYHAGVTGLLEAGFRGGEVGPVKVEVELTRLAMGEAEELVLSGPVEVETASGTRTRPPEQVRVEHPELTRLRLAGVFLPDSAGRVVLERQASRYLGQQGTVQVVLTVAPTL